MLKNRFCGPLAVVTLILLTGCERFERQPHVETPVKVPAALPVQIKALTGPVEAISSGDNHTCAKMKSGEVACWGDNSLGMLGASSDILSSGQPQIVTDSEGKVISFSSVTAGSKNTCGITEDGKTLCWGNNTFGQLGRPAAAEKVKVEKVEAPAPKPEPIPEFPKGSRADDDFFEEAVAADPMPMPMPKVEAPKAEEPVIKSSYEPLEIAIENASKIYSKHDQQCALIPGKAPLCWGRVRTVTEKIVKSRVASAVEAAIETVTNLITTHVPVPAYDGRLDPKLSPSWADATTIAFMARDACAVINDALYCLDRELNITNVVNVTAGNQHLCFLLSDLKSTYCLGDGAMGKLGSYVHERGFSYAEKKVEGLPNSRIRSLSAGANHTCIVTENNGEVWCWGSNLNGQLGSRNVEDFSDKPIKVENLAPALDVSSGGKHTCARLQDGSVWCWGDNSLLQIGK